MTPLNDAFESAAAAAKKATAAFVALQHAAEPKQNTVELAMIQDMPEWLWNLLHPKGLDGKFIKKGSGVYLFGNAKTATYAQASPQYKAMPTLEPGEKLYAKNGVMVKVNADGLAGFVNNDGTVSSYQYDETNLNALGYKVVDSAPAIEVNGSDVEQAAQNLVKAHPEWSIPAAKSYDWNKTKVADALQKHSATAVANYLYAQASLYNPQAGSNKDYTTEEIAQGEALAMLATFYDDGNLLTDAGNRATSFHAFALQQGSPEISDARVDAMASLADYIKDFTARTLKPNGVPTHPSEYLYEFVDVYDSLRSHDKDTVKTPAPEVTPESASFVHPDNAPDADAGKAVISTKAGAPYGANVWVTPDFTDQHGKPYLMSGQGEKSKYWIFESTAQPGVVINSKGQESTGLLGDPVYAAENKKSAKAWLATNAYSTLPEGQKSTPAEAPVETPAPAVSEPSPVETPAPEISAPTPDGTSWTADENGVPVGVDYSPAEDTVWVLTQDNGDVSAIVQSPTNAPGGVLNYKSIDFDKFVTVDISDIGEQVPTGYKVVHKPEPSIIAPPQGLSDEMLADLTDPANEVWVGVTPFTANNVISILPDGSSSAWVVSETNGLYKNVKYSATFTDMFTESVSTNYQKVKAANSSEELTIEEATDEKPLTPPAPVKVNFTKNSKDEVGNIYWDVLGVTDENGHTYTVISGGGKYSVVHYSGEVLGDFSKAKDAKAWLAENAGSVKPPTPDEEDFILVDEPDVPEFPNWATDNNFQTTHATVDDLKKIYDADKLDGAPDNVAYFVGSNFLYLVYGIDTSGNVVFPSTSTMLGTSAEIFADDHLSTIHSNPKVFTVYKVEPSEAVPEAAPDAPHVVTAAEIDPVTPTEPSPAVYHDNTPLAEWEKELYVEPVTPTPAEPVETHYAGVSDPADDLPEAPEAPSEANPTPGTPAAGQVKVKGYKGVPGSYTTKNVKDEDGKPYFISSNGKPNNWVVYKLADVGKYNDEKNSWEFKEGSKPLGTYKALKDAKAAIAENLFSDSPHVEKQDDGTVIVNAKVNGTIALPLNVSPLKYKILSKDNGEGEQKSYYFQPYAKGEYGYGVDKDGSVSGHSYKVSELKAYGYKLDSEFNKFDDSKYLPEIPETVDPEHEYYYDSAKAAYSGSDFLYYAPTTGYGDYPNSYSLPESNKDTLDNAISSQESVLARMAVILKAVEENSHKDEKSFKAAVTKFKRAAKVRRATINILTALRDGKDVDINDVHYVNANLTSAFSGSLADYTFSNYIAGYAKNAGQLDLMLQKARSIGFDLNWSNFNAVDSSNSISQGLMGKFSNLTDEQVAMVQQLAGSTGIEYAGVLNNSADAGYWLGSYVSGNPVAQHNAAVKLSAKFALNKTYKEIKDFISTSNVAAPSQAANLKPEGSATLSSAEFNKKYGIALNPLANSGKAFSTYKIGDEQYQYGYSGDVEQYGWTGTTSGKFYSSAEIYALQQSGVAVPNGGNTTYAVVSPVDVTLDYEGTSLWSPSAAEVADIASSGPDGSSAVLLNVPVPLYLSLVGGSNNPYTNVFEGDNSVAWGALYHKAVEVPDVAEWIGSNGDSGITYEDLKNHFFFPETDDSILQSEYVKFANSAILPKLAEISQKFDAQGNAVEALQTPTPANFPAKPDNIPQMAWDVAVSAIQGYTGPFAGQQLSEYAKNSLMQGVHPLYKTHVPESLWSAVAWANGQSNTDSEMNLVSAAAKFLIASGMWKPATNSVSVDLPSYGPKKLELLPGDKVYVMTHNSNKFAVVHDGGKSGYSFYVGYDGAITYTNLAEHQIVNYTKNYYDSNVDNPPLFTNPVNLDYKFMSSNIAGLTEFEFDLFNSNYLKDYADVALPKMEGMELGDSLLYVAQAMKQKPEAYADIKEIGLSNIPKGALKLLHYGALSNDDKFLELAKIYSKYQQFGDTDVLSTQNFADTIDPGKNYANLIQQGKSFLGWATYSQTEVAYYDFFGEFIDDSGLSIGEAEEKIDDFIDAQGKIAPASAKKAKATGNVPTLFKANFNAHGGSHSLGTWVDEAGNKWISKAFGNDPNSALRIETEHYAMRIADLYGFNPPATAVMTTPDGKYGYAQHFADAKGDLSNYDWNDIPEKAMHQTMEQHILDWIVSNHDSHGGNILLTVDGNGTFPIDRGQAFKFFPNDKLAVGYLPGGNYTAVWYDKVYYAIQYKEMSKDAADRVRDAVLRKAALITARNDAQYKEYIEAAIANKKNFPSELPTKEAFVAALMERKANTFNDFVKLWEGVYKKAGYEFDAPKDIDSWLPKQLGDAHVSVSPEFTADVAKANSIGVPLFFSGGELDNGHIQFFTSTAKDGTITLRAEARLREDADKALAAWLSNQTIEKGSTAHVYNQPTVSNDSYLMSVLPGLQSAHSSLVSYVTTVGSHIKKGDFEFNQNTVNSATQSKDILQITVTKVKEHAEKNPLETYPNVVLDGEKFLTMEQQEAWLVGAQQILDNFALVDEAYNTHISVSKAHPDAIPFEMPTYTPSTGLVKSSEAKVALSYMLDGVTYQKWEDGKYSAIAEDGSVTKSDINAFNEAASKGEKVEANAGELLDENGDDIPDGDGEEQIVTAGNKILKITHKKASSFLGKFDYQSGILKETGSEHDQLILGNEYEIKFEGITIKYQAAKDLPSGAAAQHRLMRMEISDWDGGTQKIDSLLTTLRSMGMELSEPDERALELTYWRNLYGTLKKRKRDAKWEKVYKSLVQKIAEGMDEDVELEAYRTEFREAYGASTLDDFTAKKGFLPKISRAANGIKSGRPYWLRPNMDFKKAKQALKGQLLGHSITYGGNPKNTPKIVKTGFMLSTEERLRVYGQALTGASSSVDQSSHGSSQAVYARLMSPNNYVVGFDPAVIFRNSNYTIDHDGYGDIKYKSSSPFDPIGALKHGGDYGETMTKDNVSIFDDVAYIVITDSSIRDEVLKYYKDLGITEIRGIPIEERFPSNSSAAQATADKAWDYWIKKQEDGTLWDAEVA